MIHLPVMRRRKLKIQSLPFKRYLVFVFLAIGFANFRFLNTNWFRFTRRVGRAIATEFGEENVRRKTSNKVFRPNSLLNQAIYSAFEEYLIHARPEAALEVLDGFLGRLLAIRDWFERQSILHFYASSVLLVYEGHAKLPPAVDIRMIDFSHVFPTVETGIQERDENYLYGLNKIIELFSQIRKELTQRASNGNHEDSQKN